MIEIVVVEAVDTTPSVPSFKQHTWSFLPSSHRLFDQPFGQKYSLLALMPELGSLSPKQAASLVGIAPVNNDSGKFRGKRSIRGGRRRVRKALYMAALGAIKKDRRFTEFYESILARSKAKKVAIIAVARKLLTILNAMIRDNKNYA